MAEPRFGSPGPSGVDLLGLARELLRREILPAVPPDRRGEVLMIDRAIAIAIAETVADGRETALAASLAALGFADRAALAAAIRSGARDGDAAVEAWLGDYVSVRLRRLSTDQPADEGG